MQQELIFFRNDYWQAFLILIPDGFSMLDIKANCR
jgi:hypothetical protein